MKRIIAQHRWNVHQDMAHLTDNRWASYRSDVVVVIVVVLVVVHFLCPMWPNHTCF